MIEIPAGEVHLRDDPQGHCVDLESRILPPRAPSHHQGAASRRFVGRFEQTSGRPFMEGRHRNLQHTFGRGRSDTRISRRRHRFSAVGPGRNWLPARHRGRVAVRMQGRHLRLPLRRDRRDCLVQRQFRGQSASRRNQDTQQLGPVRHDRQCLGMVLGSLRPRGLRHVPDLSRRQLGRKRARLRRYREAAKPSDVCNRRPGISPSSNDLRADG